MTGFCAVHLEGVCYSRDKQIWVRTDTGESSVQAQLTQMSGSIKLALHFWPPFGPDRRRWGYGSCLWEGSRQCPAGHHQDPLWMLNFSREGELQQQGDQWWVGDDQIPLEVLPGHRIRLLAVSLVDFKSGEPPNLRGDLEEIQSFLDKVRGIF